MVLQVLLNRLLSLSRHAPPEPGVTVERPLMMRGLSHFMVGFELPDAYRSDETF